MSSRGDNRAAFWISACLRKNFCIARRKREEEGPESLAGSRSLDLGNILEVEPSFFWVILLFFLLFFKKNLLRYILFTTLLVLAVQIMIQTFYQLYSICSYYKILAILLCCTIHPCSSLILYIIVCISY